jgi:hypothetical protein
MDTYDPLKCPAVFAGNFLEGFMDGTVIEVERAEDAFMSKYGTDGDGARAKNNNESGTIVITLLQTSRSNAMLSQQHTLDIVTGAGVAEFILKDLLGTTLVDAAEVWVKKYAKIELGKEILGRQWTLEAKKLNIFVGGSTP